MAYGPTQVAQSVGPSSLAVSGNLFETAVLGNCWERVATETPLIWILSEQLMFRPLLDRRKWFIGRWYDKVGISYCETTWATN